MFTAGFTHYCFSNLEILFQILSDGVWLWAAQVLLDNSVFCCTQRYTVTPHPSMALLILMTNLGFAQVAHYMMSIQNVCNIQT